MLFRKRTRGRHAWCGEGGQDQGLAARSPDTEGADGSECALTPPVRLLN